MQGVPLASANLMLGVRNRCFARKPPRRGSGKTRALLRIAEDKSYEGRNFSELINLVCDLHNEAASIRWRAFTRLKVLAFMPAFGDFEKHWLVEECLRTVENHQKIYSNAVRADAAKIALNFVRQNLSVPLSARVMHVIYDFLKDETVGDDLGFPIATIYTEIINNRKRVGHMEQARLVSLKKRPS